MIISSADNGGIRNQGPLTRKDFQSVRKHQGCFHNVTRANSGAERGEGGGREGKRERGGAEAQRTRLGSRHFAVIGISALRGLSQCFQWLEQPRAAALSTILL